MSVNTDLLAKLTFQVGPTKRHLERDGAPFVLYADTAWELFHRPTFDEAIHYLDTRKAQGFNAVLAVCLPEMDSTHKQGEPPAEDDDNAGSVFYPNREGERPLVNDDPATPNEAYFAHIDRVVNAAAERGLLVLLVPTWSRWVNMGWSGGPTLFTPENARIYGEFIGKRYPHLPKVLGGDSNPEWTDPREIFKFSRNEGDPVPNPLPSPTNLPRIETYDVTDAMAEGILAAEPGARLTYHPTAMALPWGPEATASASFGDRPWLTFDGCQSGHAADSEDALTDPPFRGWDARASHIPLGHMWGHPTVRPIIDLEGHYEGMRIGIHPSSKPRWNEHDVRAGAWQAVCAGTCGVVYGHNNVWQMHDPARARSDKTFYDGCFPLDLSWKDALQCPGPGGTRILVEYLLSLPATIHHSKAPAQDRLVANEAPDNAQRDARVDVLAADGFLLAHSGKGYPFTLDVPAAAAGHMQARWLDPRTGAFSDAGKVAPGHTRFVPPSSGGVEHDWVLEIRA